MPFFWYVGPPPPPSQKIPGTDYFFASTSIPPLHLLPAECSCRIFLYHFYLYSYFYLYATPYRLPHARPPSLLLLLHLLSIDYHYTRPTAGLIKYVCRLLTKLTNAYFKSERFLRKEFFLFLMSVMPYHG